MIFGRVCTILEVRSLRKRVKEGARLRAGAHSILIDPALTVPAWLDLAQLASEMTRFTQSLGIDTPIELLLLSRKTQPRSKPRKALYLGVAYEEQRVATVYPLCVRYPTDDTECFKNVIYGICRHEIAHIHWRVNWFSKLYKLLSEGFAILYEKGHPQVALEVAGLKRVWQVTRLGYLYEVFPEWNGFWRVFASGLALYLEQEVGRERLDELARKGKLGFIPSVGYPELFKLLQCDTLEAVEQKLNTFLEDLIARVPADALEAQSLLWEMLLNYASWQLHKAITLAEVVQGLPGYRVFGLTYKACSLIKMGNYKQALEILEDLADSLPEFIAPVYRYIAGLVADFAGFRERAVQHYTECADILKETIGWDLTNYFKYRAKEETLRAWRYDLQEFFGLLYTLDERR